MIILVTKDGSVEPYLDYDFIKGNMLALYGDVSYIVEADDIELMLKNGVNGEKHLPMVYSFDLHGALTNESFTKYGVPVKMKVCGDKNSKEDIKITADLLRTTRKYDGTAE